MSSSMSLRRKQLMLCTMVASLGATNAKPPKPWEADPDKQLSAQANVPGGSFKYGATDEGTKQQEAAGSGRGKRAKVKTFYIDKTTVSNEEFRRFVRETKFVTEAETYQWSFVHDLLLDEKTREIADAKDGMGRVKDSPHWVAIAGSFWRRPEGPDSNVKGRDTHPAVHISYNDAQAYCKWANGRRLPTEKEWEFAARGGHDDEPYPWGEELPKANCMNGWHGDFPKANSKDDGWVGTAPVSEYDVPNNYGLHNMLGNVWEWCVGGTEQQRPLRGGSYVDTLDGKYNHALRVWTRMDNSPDSGSHNTGFRCASSGTGKDANLEEPPKIEQPKPKKSAKDLDQGKLQEILAERGADGLQEWMQEQGVSANIMTPAQLQAQRDRLQKMKEEMKDEM